MGNKSKRNTKRARDKRRSKKPIADAAVDLRRGRQTKLLRIATFEDGTPICVSRPANPERVLELVKEAHEHPLAKKPGSDGADTVWKELEDKLNAECGPYTFVGYLAVPGQKLVDKDCKIIGEMEPGDSFMHQSRWLGDGNREKK